MGGCGVYAGWACVLIGLVCAVGTPLFLLLVVFRLFCGDTSHIVLHLSEYGSYDEVSLVYVLGLMAAGWSNPLILFYLGSNFTDGAAKLRRRLQWILLLCIFASYGIVDSHRGELRYGYFMWIVGCLLMLVPQMLVNWDEPVDAEIVPESNLLWSDLPEVMDMQHAKNG